MKKVTESLQDITKKWRAGDVIWSAELGGMGPGYEQAIQVLLWELCSRWEGEMPPSTAKEYPKEFSDFTDIVARDLRDWGFSGAQVGQAKATAYQFLTIGYADMMNKLPEDRRIMVSDDICPREKRP